VTDLKPGDTVDVAIKGVQFAYGHNNEHNPGRLSIRADDGRRYTMPPQAAITPTGDQPPADTALQERINDALRAIDRMTDEQTLDPWTAHWLRKTLDPNPRHWPPQAGDVWDDGMPFGGSLWFACEYPAKQDDPDQTPKIGMVSVVGDSASYTPHRLLELHPEIKLVYRRKDGDQ
jgi:hypothetical protein